jgi:hypothetical protein
MKYLRIRPAHGAGDVQPLVGRELVAVNNAYGGVVQPFG